MKEFSKIILAVTMLVFGIFLPMQAISAPQETGTAMVKSKMKTANVPPGNPDDAPPPGNPDDAPPPGNPDDAPPGNPDRKHRSNKKGVASDSSTKDKETKWNYQDWELQVL